MSRSTRIAIFFALAVILAFAVRVMPHIPNFTPMLAVAMLAGAYLPRSVSIFVPLSIMVASDAVIGGYAPLMMVSVYGSIVLSVAIGWYLKSRVRPGNVFLGSVAGPAAFFLVTNAAVWQFSGMYPPGVEGLMMSYVAALPFFKNTLVATVGYTAVLFPAFEVVCNKRYVSEAASSIPRPALLPPLGVLGSTHMERDKDRV